MATHSDRIFVLAGGKSCDEVDYLDFLRNEYVIAISRWLFYDGYKFDFYFVNDAFRLIPLADKHGGLSELKNFFSSDSAKWVGGTRKSTNEKYSVHYGGNTYFTSSNGCWNNKSAWELNDAEFLNLDGTMPRPHPQDYFSDEWFAKYKIPGTGCGTATRCATDLAYFLRFKTCYILGIDTFGIGDGGYSKHIMKYAVSNRGRKTPYKSTSLFHKKVWPSRYKTYKGMDIRRVVPKDMFYQELKHSPSRKMMANHRVQGAPLSIFKNVLYEDLVDGIPDVISDVDYYDWVP